jgi:thioredoxin-related protein
MKILNSLVVAICMFFIAAGASIAQTDSVKAAVVTATKFDPSRDAEQDIKSGVLEAERTNRHLILDVGGEWCIWCHRLDAFFSENKDVHDLLNKNYVVVKVNYSKENKNESLLSKFPRIAGYPHLFVLDQKGTLLHSQNTGDLESGKGYDKSKVLAFLKLWVPKAKG